MKSNLQPPVFILIGISSYLCSQCNQFTTLACVTETTTEPINDEWPQSIESYKKFSDSVFAALSELAENNSTDVETEAYDDAGSVASLIGVSYILISTTRFNFGQSVSYPGFDQIIQEITEDLYSAFHKAQVHAQDTWELTNLIFVPVLGQNANSSETHELRNTENSLEVIPVDFDNDELTIPLINEKISSVSKNEMTNYIPDGVLISTSTLAILFNIVQAQLKWANPLVSIGRKTFQGVQVEFLELTGNVKVIERDSEVEVVLFFENEKSGLALRMPKDIHRDRSVANIEQMQDIANSDQFKIQIPRLNYTLRSQYNFDSEDLNSCNFEKKENLLQLLDVLTYVSTGTQFFEVVAISGGQINNVVKYKEEMRQYENSQPQRKTLSTMESEPKQFKSKSLNLEVEKSGENFDVVDPEYLDVNENEVNPSEEKNVHLTVQKDHSKSSTAVTDGETEDHPEEKIVNGTKKIITFNRGFTWLLFDDFNVPILAGVVESFNMNFVPEEESLPNLSFLGMESGQAPHMHCF